MSDPNVNPAKTAATAPPSASPAASSGGASRSVNDRFRQSVRRQHGADGWLLELLAPLRHLRIGRFSVGEVAEGATFCLRHLREDRAGQIAATLAFRTLFGLVPVLVVVTLAARAMLGTGFETAMTSFFLSLGMGSVTMSVPSSDGSAPPTTVSLAQWIEQLVGFAGTLNVAALGWTGFVLVAFSAIWVLTTIEEAFNTIFRCEYGRSWIRRMLVYWFVLTFGPLVLGLAPLALSRVGSLMDSLSLWTWLAELLNIVISLVIFWISLFVAYITIPATRVSWRPAMVGAFTSAMLLLIGKATFGLYLANAFGVSALYGSLGLVPLFMFWVYLMWLVILFGAEIAALMQAIRRRSRSDAPMRVMDAESVLLAMRAITERFKRGEAMSLAEVATVARLPSLNAASMIDHLEDLGVVRRLGDGGTVMLARPAESIELAQLLDAAWESGDGGHGVDELTRRLRDAQKSAVAGKTLHDE
jgi:membrane protein